VSNPRYACQYCDHGTGHAPDCPDAPPVPACPGCAALEAQLATVEAVLADEQRNVRLETEAHDRTRARMREIEAERAALEAEVRRLEAERDEQAAIIADLERAVNAGPGEQVRLAGEAERKAALLAELVAAARDFQWNPSSNPEVLQAAADRLDEVRRRAEAEAGGEARFQPPATCREPCYRDGQWRLSQAECGCYSDWLQERAEAGGGEG
jgi:septal ring factor EnvC (AmiA/AmiB activator)